MDPELADEARAEPKADTEGKNLAGVVGEQGGEGKDRTVAVGEETEEELSSWRSWIWQLFSLGGLCSCAGPRRRLSSGV